MKLAILDRDGTLNALGDGFIASAADWTPLPGALEAVARLNHGGWHVVLATNQPGLGRGLFDAQTLVAIHTKMHRQLAAAGARRRTATVTTDARGAITAGSSCR